MHSPADVQYSSRIDASRVRTDLRKVEGVSFELDMWKYAFWRIFAADKVTTVIFHAALMPSTWLEMNALEEHQVLAIYWGDIFLAT